jgi:cell wall-associated NlpC family hydrolase
VKGLGADCIHFVARVFEEMGVLRWRKNLIPLYPRDWHLHDTRELLKESLERELPGEWVDKDAPRKNGDIILFHYGRASAHAAIYFGGYFYQSHDGAGVRKLSADDNSKKRIRFVYRVNA